MRTLSSVSAPLIPNTSSIFAFLHIKCFTYKVYVPDICTIEGSLEDHRTPRLKSLGHAMNPMEMFRELWAGVVYIFRKWRGKETDKQARRLAAHQGVFGHSRSRIVSAASAQNESLIRDHREKKREKQGLSQVEPGWLDDVLVDVEREVYVGSERQWLGVGDYHDYVLGSITREKSGGFEDAVASELYKRGYTLRGEVLFVFPTVYITLTLKQRPADTTKAGPSLETLRSSMDTFGAGATIGPGGKTCTNGFPNLVGRMNRRSTCPRIRNASRSLGPGMQSGPSPSSRKCHHLTPATPMKTLLLLRH